MEQQNYTWTDNPTVSGVSRCDTDVLNECLMHLKYNQKQSDGFNLFDIKITDRKLIGDEALGWVIQGGLVTMTYPDAVAKIKDEYEEGSPTTYREIECVQSLTGRFIADISQKEGIDQLYTNTGIADFYIIDTVNNQFYLPRNDNFLQLTADTTKVNQFKEAGIPNLKGNKTLIEQTGDSGTGPLRVTRYLNKNNTGNGGSYWSESLLSFDASRCSPIYGKSDTVQPASSTKLLYYKVGDTVINESEIDIANVLQELQFKTDNSLGNINSTGRALVAAMAMPSDRYIDISRGTINTIYTAPADGYVSAYGQGGSAIMHLFCIDRPVIEGYVRYWGQTASTIASGYNQVSCTLPIRKGQYFRLNYGNISTWCEFRFYYAQGVEND